MRFTRLRLNGFKSFVDPTDLVIREGLTGIVGPNGCGKSNLLEALRWVMGENRPTAMRGSGMDDVVFAGTMTRPARAFAEVTLTVDNAERLAPAGFNDSDLLEVTRRITRDAGSAYRLNGKEVRARDVQMLFADASTGAHSPALVRQGQISELINAKPRARRRVLEEAAGISGLYQRRHEAELRLNATETNLARVGDVLDQLAQQVQMLARQARQAARYRELGAELRRAEGVMLLARWREAAAAQTALQAELAEALRLLSLAERGAQAARVQRETAEDALPPLREEEAIAGALLQRLQVQRDSLAEQEARARETIRDLTLRIEQFRRDAERESTLARDADDTIERLQWEGEQLARAAEGQEDRLSDAADAAAEASETLIGFEEALAAATEEMARLSARHQSVRRQIDEARQEQDRTAAAMDRAAQDCTAARIDAEAAQEALDAALEAAEDARIQAEDAEAALLAADEARADAQDAEAETRAALAAAEGETGALAAECAALERLVARDTPAGGQVLDHLTVTPGFEAALGAALGEDLRAPLTDQGSGWRNLPPIDHPAPLPDGAEPLSGQVRAPAELARRLALVGVVSAQQAGKLHAQLHPGQRLVTPQGDLWRWDGLYLAAADAPSAAAQRLIQRNRLSALRAELSSAQAGLDAARQRHATAAARLSDLSAADRSAREARRAADLRLTEALRACSQTEAALSRARSRQEAGESVLAGARAAAQEAAARLTQGQAAISDLPDLEQVRDRLDQSRMQVDAARSQLMARRATLDDLRREGAARRSRAQEVARDLQAWIQRKANAADRVAELERRCDEALEALEDAAAAPEDIATRRAELSAAIAQAESRRSRAIDALLTAESALRAAQDGERTAERGAGEAREIRVRAEARIDAAAEAVTLAAERIFEAQECTPQDLAARLGSIADAPPDTATLEGEIARLRRAREALGAVNLRAEEDQRAAQAELDALTAERADLEAAVAKLRSGINALNREGRERLLAAFEQVNANFAELFTHLFGGGEARLVLVESDDPLEAGLEILCQPPGKKLSSLSLLSGGEQTLTALALIFGVFLANPAPICVLDEVDAPLDDANVLRFCGLMDEMTRRTQTRFLIITHNALTMARMDRLFGVTMAERGVSQLVSVDLARAEALVA